MTQLCAAVVVAAALACFPSMSAADLVYDQHGQIMAAGSDGSNPRVLVSTTDTPGMEQLVTPNVSPAGATVVFGAKWAGADAEWSTWNPPLPGAYGIHAMGIYKLAGGAVTRLSLPPASCHQTPGAPCAVFEENPTVGPDGTIVDQYTFTLEHQATLGGPWAVASAYRALAHPPRAEQDGSGNETLDKRSSSDVQTPCDGSDPDVAPHWPALSPDGTKLAYSDCVDTNSGNYALIVAAATGDSPTACGEDDAKIITPSWSPDGHTLVDAESGNLPGIWLYDATNCSATPTQALSVPSGWAVQSPHITSGDTIVFVAIPTSATDQGEVYSIPSSCGQGGTPCSFPADAQQLTSGGGIYNLAWSTQTLQPVAAPPSTPPPSNTPTTSTPAPPPVVPAIQAAPAITLSVAHQRLRAIARRHALYVRCRIAGAGRCALTLTISASTARRLHMRFRRHARSVTIGRGSHSFRAAGRATIRIRLSHAALRAVRHARSLTATLTAVSTAGGHRPVRLRRTVRLRR